MTPASRLGAAGAAAGAEAKGAEGKGSSRDEFVRVRSYTVSITYDKYYQVALPSPGPHVPAGRREALPASEFPGRRSRAARGRCGRRRRGRARRLRACRAAPAAQDPPRRRARAPGPFSGPAGRHAQAPG